MRTFYEVLRTRTCKAIGPNIDWYTWDKDRETFASQDEVKKFLMDEYGTCKREKMYRDTEHGEPEHVGYIYCYNTPKASYDDKAKNNQDWVEVREVKANTVIV